MAIITVDRPRLLGGQYLQQNLKTRWPATSGFTGYPGDLLCNNAGRAYVNNTASTTSTASDNGGSVIGICEQYIAGQSVDDPVQTTLLLPFILYEANILNTTTVAQTAFVGHNIAPQAIVSYTGTNIGVTGTIRGFAMASVTATAGQFKVVAFKGFEDQYVTHTFVAAAGTAPTAGATHVPSVDAGASGDQNPRVVFTVGPQFTIWGGQY